MKNQPVTDNVVYFHSLISRQARESRNGHRAPVLWFTGLPGAGKSTISHALEKALFDLGIHCYVFDGDNVRHGLCGDLGFSETDRKENLRRIGEMLTLFQDAGVLSMAAFVSPMSADRKQLRDRFSPSEFYEVFCDVPVEVCIERDPKGHYARALRGEIKDFTGVSAPYEAPHQAEVVLPTDSLDIQQCVALVLERLRQDGVIPRQEVMEE